MSDAQQPLWSDDDIHARAKDIRDRSGIHVTSAYWLAAKEMRDEYEAKLADSQPAAQQQPTDAPAQAERIQRLVRENTGLANALIQHNGRIEELEAEVNEHRRHVAMVLRREHELKMRVAELQQELSDATVWGQACDDMRAEYEAKLTAVQDKCLCDCDACKYCEKSLEDSHE